MFEQDLLLDRAMEPLLNQQLFNLLRRLASAIVNFHYDLIDLKPVALLDASQDTQFAFLCINLEQIDLFDLVLPDNVRD